MLQVVEKAEAIYSIETMASLVKRLGNPVSTILLDTTCCIFQIPEVDGFIGYQLIRSCAVVFGDPVCLPENTAKLTKAFHFYCQKRNLRIIYLLVSNSFARWAIHNGCNTLIQTGEELFIDPTNYPKKQKLRWKINQSIKHGVEIKEYQEFNPSIENQIKETIAIWLKEKHGPQIHLGDLNHFDKAENKRVFYALHNNQVIGVLKLSPVDRFQGWALSYSITLSQAPVGTSEHLMCFAFDTIASENCHYLCLGAIAGSNLGEMIGLSPFTQSIVHFLFKITKRLFNLDARKVYLFKYRPHSSPTYFLVSGRLTLMDLLALKEILNVKLCFQ